MKATIMTSRIHKLLAACAAFAFVVPTTLLAQQPTNLQLHNINAGAVGGRWLLQPGTATSGLYQLLLPNTNGTLLAATGAGTLNRMTRWTGPSTLGDASLDDDGSGVLSRSGAIQINPGAANTISTNGSLVVNGAIQVGDGLGTDNVWLNTGAGSFSLATTNGLNVWPSGDILDNSGAVVINDPQGLNVLLGGVDIDAGGLNVDAGGATILGATNINNSGAASAVNINTSGVAGTTTIGNNFAGNTINLNSAVINAPDLPATGAIADELVTTNGTALRTATVATMLGGTPWLINGNTAGANASVGTNDAFDLNLETNGTTRLAIAAAGGITALNTFSVNTAGGPDLVITEAAITRGASFDINAGVSGTITTNSSVHAVGNLTVDGQATLGNGSDIVSINAGLGTFTLSSSGLAVTALGDISDGNSAVVINDAQGLNVQTGGVDIDAGGLNVDAGGATILGTTTINNVAAANTTTIGNAFAGNNVSVPSASVTMANLPAGAVTDNLVTSSAGALRIASVATMLGNTAWLVGGNALGSAGAIGTNDANDLNLETNGTTRFTITSAGALNQQASGGNISLTGNVGIEAAPVNSRSLTASKTAASAGANIGAVGYASGGAGNSGLLGAVGANAADIAALEAILVSTTSNAGVSGYNHLGAGNNYAVAAYADQNNGNALVATAAGNNGLGILVAANIGTGTTGMQIDASGTGIVINSTSLGLNVQTGGVDIDAGGLNVGAGGATILGATNINNSGGSFAVNINTSANASTTTIGNNTALNTVTVNAPVVNMANLPGGLATDDLVTTAAGVLRRTSVATMLGTNAWLVGGNSLSAPGAVGTNDAFDFLLEANGTTRMTIAQAGTILMDPDGSGASEYSFATTQLTINTDGTAGANDLLIAEGALSRTGNIAINPGAGNDVTTNGGLTVTQDLNVSSTTNQITLGTGNTTTITAPAPAAARIYTMPDVGTNADFVMTEGAQTVNGNKTHLGNVALNNSGAGTTGLGSGTATGTVTIGNTANATVVGSELAYSPSNPTGIAGPGGGTTAMATFTTSFVRIDITEVGAAYNVTLPAGTSDGQIVYLRLNFIEAAVGGNTVTIQGVGGAPNFMNWAGVANEVYQMHLIWDNTAGEWQLLASVLQP